KLLSSDCIYLVGGNGPMSFIRTFIALGVICLVAFGAAMTSAQKNSRTKDAARHAGDAANAFWDIMNVKDKAIPKELLDRAEAIAVFPAVVKAAFIVGGRGG